MARLDRVEVLEKLGGVVGLGRVERGDLDERRERGADQLGVEDRTVAGDDASGLQATESRLDGRDGEPDGVGELRQRRTPVS